MEQNRAREWLCTAMELHSQQRQHRSEWREGDFPAKVLRQGATRKTELWPLTSQQAQNLINVGWTAQGERVKKVLGKNDVRQHFHYLVESKDLLNRPKYCQSASVFESENSRYTVEENVQFSYLQGPTSELQQISMLLFFFLNLNNPMRNKGPET